MARMTSSKPNLFIDWHLPNNYRLQTENLELVPANPQLAEADWNDRKSLSAMLNASVPDEWPPQLVTDESSPNGEGWWDWYVLKRDGERAIAIGIMGLKGWPSISRSIQVGCSFLPEYRKQGHGAEAVDAITSWALGQPNVECVVAETPRDNRAAARVLGKLGFVQVHSDADRFLRFEKRRERGATA
jgi:[ribosomal protein S5]-alanine N-acetyltransferase